MTDNILTLKDCSNPQPEHLFTVWKETAKGELHLKNRSLEDVVKRFSKEDREIARKHLEEYGAIYLCSVWAHRSDWKPSKWMEVAAHTFPPGYPPEMKQLLLGWAAQARSHESAMGGASHA